MPVIVPPLPIEKSKPGHGGGGVHPPAHGGGGDNGPGDGSFGYGRRLHRARLALLLGLFSICALFVTITIVFMLMRHGAVMFDARSGNYIRQWVPVTLPVRPPVIQHAHFAGEQRHHRDGQALAGARNGAGPGALHSGHCP